MKKILLIILISICILITGCNKTKNPIDLPNEKTEYHYLEHVNDITYELINNDDVGIINSSPSFVTFYSINGKHMNKF